MIYTRIMGVSGYLPRTQLTNHDIAQMVETSDEWIQKRTGIVTRHIAEPHETTLDMAFNACKPFIDQPIDMIIVGCFSQEKRMPGLASRLQLALNKPNIPVLDLNAACSGFVYALTLANAMIKSEQCQSILVVGVDKNSNHVDWTDRSTCCLFGDGAGAVLVGADNKPGILYADIGSDPTYVEDLRIDKNSLGDEYIFMNGKKVFKAAVTCGQRLVKNAIDTLGRLPDYTIFHQANKRIIDAIAAEFDMEEDLVSYAVKKHANTSAASIPLALEMAIAENKVHAGDHVLLTAFGAGFSWGSILLQY